MQNIYATLITIGDELLIGQVIDTNSAWMAQELNKAGILVKQRISVGDVKADVIQALDDAQKQTPVVLITGGLGPTADDITKPLLCEYFGGKLVLNETVLEHVSYLFEHVFKRPMPLLDRNRRQAEVPDVCEVVHNAVGTAPGMWFQKNGVHFVSMPGVPHEMKRMMKDSVIPKLRGLFSLPFIVHRTLLTYGVGESYLADMIQSWEEALPAHIKLAYLPNYGMVRLRLSASGSEKALVEQDVEAEFEKLQVLVAEYLVTNRDEPMEAVVARLLRVRNKTMSTAESCTGGYIAHLITAMPGSSAYYNGSVVSYAYAAKEDLLGVDKTELETQGAVSETVVVQMLKGLVQQLKTDYGVAVSGIMGPDGGTPEKPVGTVWVAAGSASNHITQKFHFRFDRGRNIEITAANALNLLRKFILADSVENI